MTQLKTPPTASVSRGESSTGLGGIAEASVTIPWSVAIAGRLSDYLELAKPRISVMVLITVSVGFALASQGSVSFPLLAHALLGVAFVAAGSSALNQYLERETDSRMARTANRPLPSGRLLPMEVLGFGIVSGLLGFSYLASFVNVTTALLSGLTYLIYVMLYTPMKRTSSLCTALGAVPGALPPVLGWTAAGGELNSGALSIFGILYLWQFPHFLAIAWLYREQYSKAGLKMLPAGGVTGFLAAGYALALLPISLWPSQSGLAGSAYFFAALVLGLGYFACAVNFMREESPKSARRLLLSSLIYLPVLLLVLTWDHFRLLQ